MTNEKLSKRGNRSAEKARFLTLYAEGKLQDPKTNAWMSVHFISRLLDVPSGTVTYWVHKHCPDFSEAVTARGTKTPAFYRETKALFIELVESGQHLFSPEKPIPAYMLADRLGISTTTVMKWARELFPELAAKLAEGHCNPRNPDTPEVREMQRRQREAVSRVGRYRRGVNTRRVNKAKKALFGGGEGGR